MCARCREDWCSCVWWWWWRRGARAVTLPLMSVHVAETERLMHSGSSPLAATGLPRATADDSFNCFQSFRLVPAQWRRVLVCMCVGECAARPTPKCARSHCLPTTTCTCAAHLMNVFCPVWQEKGERNLRRGACDRGTTHVHPGATSAQTHRRR